MTIKEINIRDPFVLPYQRKYYMYGTRGVTCWGECDGFDVYVSENLIDWSGPIEAFISLKASGQTVITGPLRYIIITMLLWLRIL